MPGGGFRFRSRVPSVSERRVALRVTLDAERMIRRGHPWVYGQAIRRQSHPGKPGDLAAIFDHRNRFLAVGLYDPTSPIRVRVLQARRPAPIDRAWYEARMQEALKLREGLAARTNGMRLIHGENDGLPGLVLDRYDTVLVLKLYTAAWAPHLEDVLGAILEVHAPKRVVLRWSRGVREQASTLGARRDGAVIYGPPLQGPVFFEEDGLRFEIDPVRGQKTGFFLDQRDNRTAVSSMCRHGAVLDVFAYTGGFSVAAAKGGAREVVSVDLSREALDAAARNMQLNRRARRVPAAEHYTIAGDAFSVLAALRKQRRQFDVVLVDPPSFATSQREAASALAGYARLTKLALGVLRSGGILVQSSCSGQVPAEEFFTAIYRAAAQAGWRLNDVARTGHPVDHPVSFREGAYLTCLIAVAALRKLQ